MIVRFWLALFLAATSLVFASDTQSNNATGVLVVTYNTGRNAERLDRVRFRLINEQKEQTMFPRTGTFYDKASPTVRRVTISDLPAGHYVIEFVAPNQDGFFGELPHREITIAGGDITKIDQAIKPHYARVTAVALLPEKATSSNPTLRLCDSSGTCVASSHNGELMTNNVLPGKYTLFFDSLGDYITPDPIHFVVTPGAVLGPFERHYRYQNEAENKVALERNFRQNKRTPEQVAPSLEPQAHQNISPVAASTAMTTLQTTEMLAERKPKESGVTPDRWSLLYPTEKYSTSEKHNLSLEDIPSPGAASSLSLETTLQPGESITIIVRALEGDYQKKQMYRSIDGKVRWSASGIPPGRYEVSVEVPDSYFEVAPQTVNLAAGQSQTLSLQLREARAVRVTTNSNRAEFTLLQTETGRRWQGKGRRYVFSRLQPGEYRLTFSAPAAAQLVAPDDITVQLSPEKDSQLNVTYEKTVKK